MYLNIRVLPMQRKRRIYVLLLAILIFPLFIAGCEKIAGLKQTKRMEIGKPAPDFVLQDATGHNWKLSSLKGKVVFVNFWATWCKPCRDEMPSMEALNRAMAGQPFQMLSIVFNDDLDMANSYARRLGATFPVLANPGPELTEAYMITGVPETFLIDADGILRQKFIGPYNWDTPEMRNIVQELCNTSK
jgi:cytochrome c biogenesis protein CcmG/thiol:disulfide interchange protein DsbE